MRSSLKVLAGLAAAGLTLAVAPLASAQTPAERSLLGVRIWRTWRDVLQKHGQPTRIEVGAPAGTPGGGGGGALMRGGGPGGGALPGMGGAVYGGGGMMGPTGGPGGMMGMMGRGGGMQSGGGGASKMGAMMGMDSGGPGGAPSGMMAMGGAMPGGGGFGGAQQSSGSEGEVTWVYERGPLTYHFLFNKDGRVIQIAQFGYIGGTATSRGVKLGDQASKIYATYGWADSTVNEGNQLMLDYSQKAHVGFQLLDSGKGMRVVGIIVAEKERGMAPGTPMIQPGGMMGGPGMGMGGPGMMGAMMGGPMGGPPGMGSGMMGNMPRMRGGPGGRPPGGFNREEDK